MDYIAELCCVKCKNTLIESNSKLKCTFCEASFDITDGIPVLVDLDNLDDQLKGQIKYFDNDPVLLEQNYVEYAWQKSYINRLENTIYPPGQGEIAIDCATGTGYIAIALARRGYKVYATDLNLKALTRLKSIVEKLGLSENIKLICCAAEDIPLKQNLVTVITANAILEHLPDDVAAINEYTRIAKPGAYAMVTTPLKYKYLFPPFIRLNKYYDKKIGHLRRYDEMEYREKFKGWDLVRTYYTGHVLKVVLVIINKLIPIISEEFIEIIDRKRENSSFWASNIISFFKLNDKKIS